MSVVAHAYMLAWLPTFRAVCEMPGRPARCVLAHARWHAPGCQHSNSLSVAGHVTHLMGAPMAGPPASDGMCERVTAITSSPMVHETPVTGTAARGAGRLTVLPRHAGSKCRYTYVAVAGSGAGQRGFTGLAKIDLAADSPAQAVAGRVLHGAGLGGRRGYLCAAHPGRGAPEGCAAHLSQTRGFLSGRQLCCRARTEDAATLMGELHPSLTPHPHKHGVTVRQQVCCTCEIRPTSKVCCPPLT